MTGSRRREERAELHPQRYCCDYVDGIRILDADRMQQGASAAASRVSICSLVMLVFDLIVLFDLGDQFC